MVKHRRGRRKRHDFLRNMIHRHDLNYGCEIGTGSGRLVKLLMAECPELHLIEVAWYPSDKIIDDEKKTGFCETQKAKEMWLKEIEPYLDRITVIEKPSVEAALQVKDESLDFIFIDADHKYKNVIADLKAWVPKVRKGGLLSGHDYHPDFFPDVKKAVDEYFGRKNFKKTYDNIWFKFKPND